MKSVYPIEEAEAISSAVLDHYLGVRRSDILRNKELDGIDSRVTEVINSVLDRLLKNEPIQYVIGETEFYGCKILVNSSVLIPRRETEEMVDLIIRENKDQINLRVLDICTGSGCIPIALSKNLKNGYFSGLDISTDALNTAILNAEVNEVSIDYRELDILRTAVLPWKDSCFDIIVSNPPYVTESEKILMHGNVLDYEPALALFVFDDAPLIFYDKIIHIALRYLKPAGRLYLEINEKYGQEVSALMKTRRFTDIKVIRDMQGKERIVRGDLSKLLKK